VNNSTNDSTTHAERSVDKGKKFRVGKAILALGALLGAIGTILAFPSTTWQAIEYWVNPPDKAYEFSQKDLEKVVNQRFAFSFKYPKTWDRKDPTNNDGFTFVNPMDPDTEISAWGAHVFEPGDTGIWDDYQEQLPGYRPIEDVRKGMWLIDTKVVNGKSGTVRMELPGRRLKYEYDRNGKKVTVLEVRTEYQSEEYAIQCASPSSDYPKYETLCFTIVNSLRVLGEHLAPNADR